MLAAIEVRHMVPFAPCLLQCRLAPPCIMKNSLQLQGQIWVSPDATFLFKALYAEKSRKGQIKFSVAFILAWSYSVELLLEQCNG